MNVPARLRRPRASSLRRDTDKVSLVSRQPLLYLLASATAGIAAGTTAGQNPALRPWLLLSFAVWVLAAARAHSRTVPLPPRPSSTRPAQLLRRVDHDVALLVLLGLTLTGAAVFSA